MYYGKKIILLVIATCALPAAGIFPRVFYYGSKETSEVWCALKKADFPTS
jgi:hypothetical protein